MAALNLSQALKSGGLTLNTPKPQLNLNSYTFGTSAQLKPLNLTQAINSGGLKSNTGQVLGAQAPINPSTGGQAAGAGAGTSGGSSFGNQLTLQAPSIPQDTSQQSLDILRQQYGLAANDLQNQGAGLDQSYNLSKNDIQSAIDQNTSAANSQKDQLNTQFGDVLKNQLNTYQDLGRQRQGTFSALGTLDSSAYGEQQFRADQSLAEGRATTDREQTRAVNDVDTQLNTYKSQAQSQLAQLALQYQQGKQAIQSAIANNSLQEAGAIQSALDQIRQRASQVQDSIINFTNQAALLKSQGANVKTNIAGVNGNDYASQVLAQLQGVSNQGKSLYQVPTNNAQGQGYIAPNGKRYNSQQEYLASLQ